MGTHRQYDRSFKERAVKMSYERDNIKTLASELGITAERIYKWRREFAEHGEASFQGHGVERLSDNMTAKDTTVRAYNMAVRNRETADGMVFHSDRGVLYASEEFRSEIKGKVVQSMSRKGNCGDNAVAESFFRSLKCEMIYGNKTLSAQKMELEIFEYIEIWYNKARRHSALQNMTIDEFWSANKKSA